MEFALSARWGFSMYGRYRYYPRLSHRSYVSALYGGVDEDVRQIFFNLDPLRLESLFKKYESKHGYGKRQYAQRTYEKWKSGDVAMSGEISERLLILLPAVLTFDEKYELIRKLITKAQFRLERVVRVRPDSGFEEISNSIHIALVESQRAEIPTRIAKRLEWLSEDDARMAENLMKAAFGLEAEVVRRETEQQARGILEEIRNSKGYRVRGEKIIKVGVVSIRIHFENTPILVRLWQTIRGY